MKKKQWCQCLAGLVSICFVVCLLNTIEAFKTASSTPVTMLFLTIVTALCTVIIWRSIMKMDD